MVLEAVVCKHCGQTKQVKRYETTRTGIQRYRCYDCGRTFVWTYTHKARDPLIKAQITQMALNGSGVRDTARVLGVNRNTVSNQFKKKGVAHAVLGSFMSILLVLIKA
ncbi:IS1-like element transposase [Spirosoma endophyticum]|uniref:InsA C-terminal domain-containing protein n=1 Tax=Spirosoma endophyticum TaxID=662367 RepID=A0A1I2FRC0_9BACT|nr:InsA C-terminal domain-containing protein [Spirosoma endophyticum]